MVKTTKNTNTNQFNVRFKRLSWWLDTYTTLYARKFIVGICWVGYYTAAVLAVVLFVPALIFKAARISYAVVKKG
jgi:hypothetical protein